MSINWNYLGSIFSRPGTDFASYISSTIPISVGVASTINEQYQEAFDKNMKAIAKVQSAEKQGLSELTISELSTATLSGTEYVKTEDGKIYQYYESNGQATWREAAGLASQIAATGNKAQIVFDLTDQQDYNNRYTSVDFLRRNNDASDVAFFNIIKNDVDKKVVFPNYNEYQQPGITKSKFRQFILIQMNEASQEKMQLVESSEDFQVLFFGKKPEILSIMGVLKNTVDNPWSTNMLFVWSELMRGTKLVENGCIMQFYADGELFRGYPFNFQRSKVAPNDFIVNFSMNFVIKERINIYNTTINLDTNASNITEGYQFAQGNIL